MMSVYYFLASLFEFVFVKFNGFLICLCVYICFYNIFVLD